jgi:hypothetical protein
MIRAFRKRPPTRISPRANVRDVNPHYNADMSLMPTAPFQIPKVENEVSELRLKEVEDWKLISLDDKTILYFGYFDRTVVDVFRPLDSRNGIIGIFLIFASTAILLYDSYKVSKTISYSVSFFDFSPFLPRRLDSHQMGEKAADVNKHFFCRNFTR